MENGLIVDGILPKSEEERQRLWGIRENFEPEKRLHEFSCGFDVSLKIEEMNDYVESVRKELKKVTPTASLYTLGHIGDNNIHFSVAGLNEEEIKKAYSMIYNPLKELNGSVSAEHGIGLKKKA